MPYPIDDFVNVEAMKADLPAGVSMWWVRGRVLHTEIINRKVGIAGAGLAHFVQPDTVIALSDRDEPGKAYEIRLQGRVEAVTPGDNLELLGHHTPWDNSYLPRLAGSLKHSLWWMALRPVREGDPGFIIQQSNKVSSYDREGDGCFTVNVPRSVNEGLAPAADAVRSALGKLAGSVTAPGAAPEPVRAVFGKLMGAAARAATAPPAPSFTAIDMRPMYMDLFGALVSAYQRALAEYGIQSKEKKDVAGSAGTDDGNLPPI